MLCKNALALISKEIDGELTDAERRELKEHLSRCPDCACARDAYGRVEAETFGSEVPIPSDEYWADFARRVIPHQEIRATGRGYSGVLIAVCGYALAAVCMAVLGLTWLRAEKPEGRALGSVAGRAPAPAELPWPVEMPPLRPAMQQEQAEAFRVLKAYFQGGLQWMAQDGEQTEIGVSSTGSSSPAGSDNALVVSLGVVCADAAGSSEMISSPTLMILPGAEAQFRMQGRGGFSGEVLRYRCAYSATSSLVLVTVELTPRDSGMPVRLSAVVDRRMRDDSPVAFSRSGDHSYLLMLHRNGARSDVPAGKEA